MKEVTLKKAGIVGALVRRVSALMPLIGYLLGSQFERYITSVDHWIALSFCALSEAL